MQNVIFDWQTLVPGLKRSQSFGFVSWGIEVINSCEISNTQCNAIAQTAAENALEAQC